MLLARVGLVALVTLVSIVALPRVASAVTSLSVFPSSGPAGAAFTATFFDQTGPECFGGGLTVTFHWTSLRFPAYGSATMDGSSCTAALTAPPPGTPPEGTYAVWARICPPAATGSTCRSASARYTITPAAPPTTTTTTTATTTTTTTRPPPTTTTTTTTTTLPPTTTTPSTTTTAATTTTTTATTTTTLPPTTTTTTIVPVLSDPEVSDLVAATPGPADLDGGADVLLTNLLLAGLLVLLLGTTAAVFNSTLDANRSTIEGWTAGVRRWWSRVVGGRTLTPGGRMVVILGITGLVYGFLSPDFGLNLPSLFLFVAMVGGLGALTYLNEGGAARFTSRRFGLPAGVRVHSGAVLAALACVVVSRLLGLQPGVLYGFVASAVLLAPVTMDRRQAGESVFYPALAVLVVAVGAWGLLGWVRAGSGSPLLESVLAVLFVGGVEGVMFSMMPITFMDGRAVLAWRRGAWLAIMGLSSFLFWHLIVNPGSAFLDAFRETAVRLVLLVAVGFVLVTAATWGYFRRRQRVEALAAQS